MGRVRCPTAGTCPVTLELSRVWPRRPPRALGTPLLCREVGLPLLARDAGSVSSGRRRLGAEAAWRGRPRGQGCLSASVLCSWAKP